MTNHATDFGEARFGIGDVIHHSKFDYRGVIVDIDARFEGDDEWYEKVALSRPPKEHPWYHVLVDGADHTTYVAERHLEVDRSGEPIRHPLLERFFGVFCDGRYQRQSSLN